MSTERRRFTRIDFDAESSIRIGETACPLILLDLSLKGALFESEQEIAVEQGADYMVSIKLLHSDIQLEFQSRLVHLRDNSLGFEFLSQDLETISHLRRIIELNIGSERGFQRELSELWQG